MNRIHFVVFWRWLAPPTAGGKLKSIRGFNRPHLGRLKRTAPLPELDKSPILWKRALPSDEAWHHFVRL